MLQSRRRRRCNLSHSQSQTKKPKRRTLEALHLLNLDNQSEIASDDIYLSEEQLAGDDYIEEEEPSVLEVTEEEPSDSSYKRPSSSRTDTTGSGNLDRSLAETRVLELTEEEPSDSSYKRPHHQELIPLAVETC